MSLVTRGLSTALLVTAGLGTSLAVGQLYPNICYYTYTWGTNNVIATNYINSTQAVYYIEETIAILRQAQSFTVVVDREDIENNR